MVGLPKTLHDLTTVSQQGSCSACGAKYTVKQGPGFMYYNGCGHELARLEGFTGPESLEWAAEGERRHETTSGET